jgi:hypothetical protein
MSLRLFEISFPGQVWRIEPDPRTGWLGVEVRQEDPREVSFWAVAPRDIEAQPLGLSLPDPWWVGLAACWQGALLVHGYQDPGLPLPIGVYVFDLPTGSLRWAQPSYQLGYLLPGQVLVQDPRWPSRSQSLSWEAGTLQSLSPEAWQARKQEAQALRWVGMAFPQSLRVDDPSAQPLLARLTATHQVAPQRQIDWLEWAPFTLVSWYQAEAEGSFSQHLSVWHEDALVLTQVLVSQTRQLALDPFMVFRGRLLAYGDGGQLYLADLLPA